MAGVSQTQASGAHLIISKVRRPVSSQGCARNLRIRLEDQREGGWMPKTPHEAEKTKVTILYLSP